MPHLVINTQLRLQRDAYDETRNYNFDVTSNVNWLGRGIGHVRDLRDLIKIWLSETFGNASQAVSCRFECVCALYFEEVLIKSRTVELTDSDVIYNAAVQLITDVAEAGIAIMQEL